MEAKRLKYLAVFKQELDRMGIRLLPPDINLSDASFRVEGDAVRYALAALKGVGEAAMAALVAERNKNGPFTNLENIADRIVPGTLNKRQVESMAADEGNDTAAQRPRLLPVGPTRIELV